MHIMQENHTTDPHPTLLNLFLNDYRSFFVIFYHRTYDIGEMYFSLSDTYIISNQKHDSSHQPLFTLSNKPVNRNIRPQFTPPPQSVTRQLQNCSSPEKFLLTDRSVNNKNFRRATVLQLVTREREREIERGGQRGGNILCSFCIFFSE